MNSKSSNTCKINILDKNYVINCGSSEKDMLLKSVDFLNKRIKDTRSSGSISGGEKIVVMTALNIVYDYLSSKNGAKSETETQISDNRQIEKKLHKINKKIEAALYKHKQIDLT